MKLCKILAKKFVCTLKIYNKIRPIIAGLCVIQHKFYTINPRNNIFTYKL